MRFGKKKGGQHMPKFIGNDTIVIVGVVAGFLIGVITKQDTVTSAAIGALAGYLGADKKTTA